MVVTGFEAGIEDFRNKKDQRTNGPVNAHLRSAAYTNKHV